MSNQRQNLQQDTSMLNRQSNEILGGTSSILNKDQQLLSGSNEQKNVARRLDLDNQQRDLMKDTQAQQFSNINLPSGSNLGLQQEQRFDQNIGGMRQDIGFNQQ